MIKRELAARKEYQCDVCGNVGIWEDGWMAYSSIAHDECCWDQVPHVCSDECAEVAEEKINSGEWRLPKLRFEPGGAVVSKPKHGY